MISLTNEITTYFSALAKEPQTNQNNKKNSLLTFNFETAYRIASNLCLYLKTSLALSTPLTNIFIR